jgi:hypothetical protein
MIFNRKSAVKDHLSSRNRNGIHLHRPANPPDATGLSGEPSTRVDSNTTNTVEETPNRPYASGQENSPAKTGSGPSNVAASPDSKSAQA